MRYTGKYEWCAMPGRPRHQQPNGCKRTRPDSYVNRAMFLHASLAFPTPHRANGP